MTNWVLGVELDGEWEHCVFRTRREALASFEALAIDYNAKIERAILFRQLSDCSPESAVSQRPANNYIQ